MAATQLRWDVSRDDAVLIRRIVTRALASDLGLAKRDRQSLEMDLIAVHLNIAPLRLLELAEADFFNFAHDINGIRACLNRQTGELERCFLPRFARSNRERGAR